MMLLSMAWRNVWRNKTRSIVILFSIAIGIFAGLFIISLYKGMMRSRIQSVIHEEYGHIQLHNPLFKNEQDPAFVIPNDKQLLQTLKKDPQVGIVGSRSVTQAMIASSSGSSGVTVFGIVPDIENILSKLSSKIIEGNGFDPDKHNQVLIGKKLATRIKLKLGSKVVLTMMDTSSNIVAGSFRIVGIYETDNAPLDKRQVFIKKEELNELLAIGDATHELSILLNKDQDVENLKNNLSIAFPFLLTETWKDLSPETQLMVDTIDIYSWIVMLIIFLALAFGIENTMLMAILERTREIGMMVSLGFDRIRLFLLVLIETVLLTLAGTPVGIILSWLFIRYYNKHGMDWVSQKKEMMQSFGFKSIIYPEFPWDQLGTIMTIVIGTALVSCLYPSIRAIKMLPSQSLRK